LRDQVAALEARVAQLQVSDRSVVTRATRTAVAAVSSPPRPDSRASTVYPSRAATPTASVIDSRHGTNTPPTSVWDSMHAPSVSVNDWKQHQQPGGPAAFPRGRFAVQQQDWRRQSRVASPAPSVDSVALTLRNDGWYE
jgi:hypothetical protein